MDSLCLGVLGVLAVQFFPDGPQRPGHRTLPKWPERQSKPKTAFSPRQAHGDPKNVKTEAIPPSFPPLADPATPPGKKTTTKPPKSPFLTPPAPFEAPTA